MLTVSPVYYSPFSPAVETTFEAFLNGLSVDTICPIIYILKCWVASAWVDCGVHYSTLMTFDSDTRKLIVEYSVDNSYSQVATTEI